MADDPIEAILFDSSADRNQAQLNTDSNDCSLHCILIPLDVLWRDIIR